MKAMILLSTNIFGRAILRAVRIVAKRITRVADWARETAQAYANSALESFLAGNLNRAEVYYREATAWDPRDANLHNDLAQVYYEQGKADEAATEFHEALEYDYQNATALKGLGVVLQEGGQPLDAMYLYLKYLELRPEDADVCLNLGVVFQEMGDYQKAVDYYKRAEKEDPNDALAPKNRALALLALARFEEARDALLQARKIDPEDGEIDRLLGSTRDALGDSAGALECYESAIKKDPKDPDSHLEFAYIAARLERAGDAAEHAKTALDLFNAKGDTQSAAQALWELGWDNYLLNDWHSSLQASKDALKLDPKLTPVHFNLGLVLLHLGHVDEARKEYEEGIARLAQVTDLKEHAIDDLRAALERNARLNGAAEILAMLEEKYAALSRDFAKSAQPVS